MKTARQSVKTFMDERGWNTQPPEDIAKSIIIEAAELLEHFQWTKDRGHNPADDPKILKEIIDELADVFVYATEMAIVLNVDVDEIVADKLKRAAEKYPADKIKGKLGSLEYQKIKRDYRKKK